VRDTQRPDREHDGRDGGEQPEWHNATHMVPLSTVLAVITSCGSVIAGVAGLIA
jgi:hypothetical protein